MRAAAVGKRHAEIMENSIDADRGAMQIALMTAALIGHTVAIKSLLDRGADPSASDESGRTALMEASFGGNVEALEVLLARGGDANVPDISGWTALMEAASKRHLPAVRVLLAAGADVNAVSANGWTALKASGRGNARMINLLKRAGAVR